MPRLRKTEAALEITESGDQEERLEVVEQPEETEPVEQPKRKRGRPRKVRPEGEAEPVEQPKKRGRPKKVRTPEEETEASQQPKKRGRPRKEQTEDAGTSVVSDPGDPEATLGLFPESEAQVISETPAAEDVPGPMEPSAPEAEVDPNLPEVGAEPESDPVEPPSVPAEPPAEDIPAPEPEIAPSIETETPTPTETPEPAAEPEPAPQEQEFSLKYDTGSDERYVDSTSLKTQFEKVLEELAKISKDMLSWEVDKFTERFTKKYVGEGMTMEEANAQKFEAFLGGFITNAAMDLYDRGYKDAAFHKLEQAMNVLEARRKLENEVESIKTRNEEDVVDLSDMLGLFVGDA